MDIGKLPFAQAPTDTDNLPDMHMALYNDVIAFDQATKLAYTCAWVHIEAYDSLEEAYRDGQRRLASLSERITHPDASSLPPGKVSHSDSQSDQRSAPSTMKVVGRQLMPTTFLRLLQAKGADMSRPHR